MQIFIDTVPLCALNNPRDQYHLKSALILKELKGYQHEIITTDYVVDEAATLLLTTIKGGYRYATSMLSLLFENDSLIHVEWIGKERFLAAVNVFRRYNKDKQWSFTDCTSFVIIKELKIQKVFTFDDHFRQMGFAILT